jgi:hypothetical protein
VVPAGGIPSYRSSAGGGVTSMAGVFLDLLVVKGEARVSNETGSTDTFATHAQFVATFR